MGVHSPAPFVGGHSVMALAGRHRRKQREPHLRLKCEGPRLVVSAGGCWVPHKNRHDWPPTNHHHIPLRDEGRRSDIGQAQRAQLLLRAAGWSVRAARSRLAAASAAALGPGRLDPGARRGRLLRERSLRSIKPLRLLLHPCARRSTLERSAFPHGVFRLSRPGKRHARRRTQKTANPAHHAPTSECALLN